MAIPSVTTISGNRATAATLGINSSKRVVDIRDKVFHLEADKAPLCVLMNALDRESAFNPDFNWLEDELIPSLTQVNNGAGYTAGDTTIVVDKEEYGWVNCLVQVQRTSEVMLITSLSTGDSSWTVTRSVGATAAAALVDNDYLTIIGGAAAEGSTAESARGPKSVTKTSRCQIFRTPFQVTNTVAASKLYGGPELSIQQMLGGIKHAVDMEQAALWGEVGIDTSGDEPRRYTDGLNAVISTNSRDFSGGLSLVSFFDFMEEVNRYTPGKTKLCIAGGAVMSNFSLLAEGALRSVSKDDAYGLSISQLVTPMGNVNLKHHVRMEGNENGRLFFLVDTDNIGYRYLRDTKLKTNIQANDADSRKDEYLTEAGFEFRQERTHGVGTNAASTATSA